MSNEQKGLTLNAFLCNTEFDVNADYKIYLGVHDEGGELLWDSKTDGKISCEFTPQPDFIAPAKVLKKYYWQFCDEYSGKEKAIYVVSKSFWEHNHCLDDQLQTVFDLDVLGFKGLAESMYGCPDGLSKNEIRDILNNTPNFKEKKMF